MVDTAPSVTVTVENFVRAESDIYADAYANDGGFGQFKHVRAPAPIDHQTVIRMNRDTLYSMGVFDLDAGPVTISKPDPGKRFMSMQVLNEEHYTIGVFYDAGAYTFTRDQVGTRYAIIVLRTLANAEDEADIRAVHALQDAVKAQQVSPGVWAIPAWDKASQDKVREALLVLAGTLTQTDRMFGAKDEVDPIQHLLGTAFGWGGNPHSEASYLNVVPPRNDGATIYRLVVGKVPVDGFWSISVYNPDGYFQRNDRNAYSINNLTADQEPEGSVVVQFGGCGGDVRNCLPIMPGWNYAVRMYRPRSEILDGSWRFPDAQAI